MPRASQPEPPRRKRSLAPWLALVLACTFATYAPCLGDYFWLDDFWHLAHARETKLTDVWRPWVYSWKDAKGYWFSSNQIHGLREQAFFRPLVSLAYATGVRLWGDRPVGLHGVSVVAHVATAAAVFWLAWRLFRLAWAAALAAAVFGLHPGHYEAVEWIAANADVFLALLGVISVAAFAESILRRPGGRGFYALALASFVLALGAKEMAVAIPLVLLGCEYALRPQGSTWRDLLRSRWTSHAPFVGLSLAYALWRAPSVLSIYSLHQEGNYVVSTHGALFMPQVALNFAFYAAHFLFPYPILPVNLGATFGASCWWLSALAVVVLVALVAWLARVAGPRRREFGIGAWWILVTLLPFCFVEPEQRIVHFPGAGFAIAAGAVAVGISCRRGLVGARRRLAQAAVLVLLAGYAAISVAFASSLGYVSRRVEQIVTSLDRSVSGLPPRSEIYLVDLWQPAWMIDRLFEVTRPGSAFDIQVLTFDPEILPSSVRSSPGLMGSWFMTLFHEDADPDGALVSWESPLGLTLRREHGYFGGIVEKMVDVAPEATEPGRVIDAGTFVARPLERGEGGVTALAFRWKDASPAGSRVFLRWTGDHWSKLEPPPDWDARK